MSRHRGTIRWASEPTVGHVERPSRAQFLRQVRSSLRELGGIAVPWHVGVLARRRHGPPGPAVGDSVTPNSRARELRSRATRPRVVSVPLHHVRGSFQLYFARTRHGALLHSARRRAPSPGYRGTDAMIQIARTWRVFAASVSSAWCWSTAGRPQ